MALTNEQIQEVKSQLAKQIQNLPDDQKSQAQTQIDTMSPEALEELVKEQQSSNSPYRLIIEKKLEAAVVEDTPDYLAAMEIQPKAQGHVIIIPKQAVKSVQELPSAIPQQSVKLSEKIKSRLSAKSIESTPNLKFGEIIIELIPSYEDKTKNTPAKERVPIQDLKKIAEEINKEVIKKPEPEKIVIKKEETPKEEIIKRARRIP